MHVERYLINEEVVPIMMDKVSGSTHIHSIGNTEKGSSGRGFSLIVKFHRGGVYLYKDVPLKHIEGISHAINKGEYFSSYIKSQTYTFIKIFPAPDDKA